VAPISRRGKAPRRGTLPRRVTITRRATLPRPISWYGFLPHVLKFCGNHDSRVRNFLFGYILGDSLILVRVGFSQRRGAAHRRWLATRGPPLSPPPRSAPRTPQTHIKQLRRADLSPRHKFRAVFTPLRPFPSPNINESTNEISRKV
jgi:hypothetical protein